MQSHRILYISLSLLLSLPAYSMQPVQQRVAQKLSNQFMKSELIRNFLIKKRIVRGAPLLGMQAVVVDVAKDPGTSTTVFYAGSVIVGTIGGAALSTVLTPAVAVGGGLAMASYGCWLMFGGSSSSNDISSFIAPDPIATTAVTNASFSTYENYGDEVIDPATKFIVRANDPRYAQLKSEQHRTIIPAVPVTAENVTYKKGNEKKLSKAEIAKKAAKEAAKGGGSSPKKPEDEDKERKTNPHDFKQQFKKHPRTKSNYRTHDDGSMRLKDHAKEPYKSNDGKIVDKIKGDHYHNDLEAYDKFGEHLGSMDPVTHQIYKAAVKGRDFTKAVIPPVVSFFFSDSEAKEESSWVEQSPVELFNDPSPSRTEALMTEPKIEAQTIDPRFSIPLSPAKTESAPSRSHVTRTPSKFGWNGEEVHVDWSNANTDVGDFSGTIFSWDNE